MAVCAKCGFEGQGRYCAQCGAPAGAEPPAIPVPALDENIVSALCYLLLVLTGVLFLGLAPYNQNRRIRFHAFQSIFLWIAMIAAGMAVTVVSIVLSPIPIVGFLLSITLQFGVGLGFLMVWLMLIYKAYNHEQWELPILGPLAQKQV